MIKKSIAYLLCCFMMISTVLATAIPAEDLTDDAAPTIEESEPDAQPSETLELPEDVDDEPEPSDFDEENEELDETLPPEEDMQETPSTYGVTPPLTAYELVQISGQGTEKLGEQSKLVTETFTRQSQWNNATDFTTKYYYDSSKPIVITLYREGYGSIYSYPLSSNYEMSMGSPFDVKLDSGGGATAWKYNMKFTQIDPALSELYLMTYARPNNNTSVMWKRELTIKFIDTRADAPATPQFILDPNNPDQYLMTGVDSSMQYRNSTDDKKNKWSSWTTCSGNNIPFAIPSTEVDYQVRYQATDTTKESKYTTITLPKRTSSPNVTVNWFDESLKGLTEDMEVSFGDAPYVRVNSSMIDAGVTPFVDQITGKDPVELKIRRVATSQTPSSIVHTIKLYARGAMPDKIVLNPNTFVVTGISSTMQYKGPQNTAWKSISGASLSLSNYAKADQPVTMQFRTKSTTTSSPSKPFAVELPRLAAAPSTLQLHFDTEVISGFQAGATYQYRVGTGNWTTIKLTNQTFSVSSLASTAGDRVLDIRVSGTTTSQLSDLWRATLPQRPAKPSTCKFVYNDPSHMGQAVLTGLDSTMEYRLGTTGDFLPCTGSQLVFDLPTANKTYNIRVKSTGSTFASTAMSRTLSAPAAAPSGSFNRTTEKITVSNTMEYRIDNGNYTPVPAGTTSLLATDYIDSLRGANKLVITLRFAATETKPASKEKAITLEARKAAPNTVTYSVSDQTISGATTAMQYREVGTTTWKKASSKAFSVATLLNGRTDVVLEFRFAPTTTAVASYTQTVNCY